jgi:hypothetical protein
MLRPFMVLICLFCFCFTGEAKVLRVQGVINQAFVSNVLKILEEHPDVGTLSIDSEGGQADAVWPLTQLIIERQLAVHVPRYCLSACATFVFLASSKRSMERDAIVGGFKSVVGILQYTEDALPVKWREQAQARRLREAAVLKRFPVTEASLKALLRLNRPECISMGNGSEEEVLLKVGDPLGIPSVELLVELGIEAPANWPSSGEDVRQRAARIPSLANLRGLELSTSVPNLQRGNLPLCK